MALVNLKRVERENRIVALQEKKDIDANYKTCPNCSSQFAKNKKKCPACGEFYQKFLNEHPEVGNKEEEENAWSQTIHYQHVPNYHPNGLHKLTVLDPMLGNPNSRV